LPDHQHYDYDPGDDDYPWTNDNDDYSAAYFNDGEHDYDDDAT